MKVLLYVNSDKDENGKFFAKITSVLMENGIDYDLLSDENSVKGHDYSALIVVGGDGTILRRTETALKLDIPIIGINGGKLGFLSEFEFDEIESAVALLKSGELVKDERLTIKAEFNGKKYYALNDVVLSRIYEENKGMVVNFGVKIADANLKTMIGDGVLVATPTGSTAYSLAAGGAILEPHLNAFCVTPIAVHSFLSRSIVYNADNHCVITHEGGAKAGLFIDGKLVDCLGINDKVYISNAEKKTAFLRKRDFDFFNRLSNKLTDR